jgi:serine/threonine protein kinase
MKKDNLVGFKLKDFHFISVLGSGNFSVVYEAVHDVTKERAAIKAIPLSLVK